MLLQTPTIYSHIKHRTFWQNCPIFSRLSHAMRTSWRGSTTWKTEHSGKSVPLSADCPMQPGLAEGEVLHETQNILANLSHFQQTVPCNEDWLKEKFYMKHRTFWQICPTFSRLSHAMRTGWRRSTINSYSHYISTCPCKHPHTHTYTNEQSRWQNKRSQTQTGGEIYIYNL